MKDTHGNIRKICAFSFLHKTLFPMAIITLPPCTIFLLSHTQGGKRLH